MSARVQYLPEADDRVETGVLQVGEDWPGYFMRGDFAIPLAATLMRIMRGHESADPTTARLDAQRLVDLTVSLCETHAFQSTRFRLTTDARAAGDAYLKRLQTEGKL